MFGALTILDLTTKGASTKTNTYKKMAGWYGVFYRLLPRLVKLIRVNWDFSGLLWCQQSRLLVKPSFYILYLCIWWALSTVMKHKLVLCVDDELDPRITWENWCLFREITLFMQSTWIKTTALPKQDPSQKNKQHTPKRNEQNVGEKSFFNHSPYIVTIWTC